MSNNLHPSTIKVLNFLYKRLRFYIVFMVSVLLGIEIVKATVYGARTINSDNGNQDIGFLLDFVTFGGILTLIPAVIGLLIISRTSSQSS